jgi:hypothetical protein
MKTILALTALTLMASCKAVTTEPIDSCKDLTGTYEFNGSPREISQDGCGSVVTIYDKLTGINGQSVTNLLILDGKRKLEEGGTTQHYRYYTRTWKDNVWIDKWERFENGVFHSTTTSHFYLDAGDNLVFEDVDDPRNTKVYKRLK